MQSPRPIVLVIASFLLGACSDSGGDSAAPDTTDGTSTAPDATGGTGTTDTAGTTAPTTGGPDDTTGAATDTGEPAGLGMPEGISTWKGLAEGADYTLLAEATITNTNGDLTATITLSDDPDAPLGFSTGVYSLTGTHEPTAGLVALAPQAWTVEPTPLIELSGFLGSYDPATKRLTGTIAGYASGIQNTVDDGTLTFDLVDGPGEPTVRGDEGSSLVVGSQNFGGTMQCGGPVRETAGTLDYDGAGGVTVTITLGDTDLATPLGTYAMSGVHNPSTGGITLAPGLWVDSQDNKVNTFVDGTYDPATKKYEGDVRSYNNACPVATWKSTFE